MGKRILFVDILRGAAILGVLYTHALIYGVWYSEGNALEVLPDAALAILAPIVLLATWAGIFAIMSSLVNTYNAYNKLKEGKSLNTAIRGPLVNSTIVFVIHIIYRVFFSHISNDFEGNELNSIIAGFFVTGNTVAFDLTQAFKAEALLMIAVVGWFTCLMMAILWRNEGWKKTERNFKIYLIVAVIWLIIYSIVYDPLRDFYVDWFLLGRNGEYWRLAVIFVVFKPFVAGQQVLLPYAGFGLIGMIYGVWIADEKPYGEMWNFTWKLSLVFFVAAVIINIYDFAVAGKAIEDVLDFTNIPYNLAWLNLSLMVLVVMILYKYFDKIPDDLKTKRAQRWNFFRRFGMLSLTVYVFESTFHAIVARIFHTVFGDPNAAQDDFMLNAPAIILYIVIIYTFWYLVLRFWERYNFVGTMEWLHVNIGGLLRHDKSDRLGVKDAIYTTETAD